jgi:hypothetical protein
MNAFLPHLVRWPWSPSYIVCSTQVEIEPGILKKMFSQFYKKAVAVIVSLSVAWHCVAGCCSHHPHTQSACGGHSCSIDSASLDLHSDCDHQSESVHRNLELAAVNPVNSSSSNHSPQSCQIGKCAFVLVNSTTLETSNSDGPFDVSFWQDFDIVPLAHQIAMGKRGNMGPSGQLCAISARPQQLLCRWLI